MSGKSKKACILLVNDEPTNLPLLSEALQDEYSLLVAKVGKQDLKRLHSSPADLVLLDVVIAWHEWL